MYLFHFLRHFITVWKVFYEAKNVIASKWLNHSIGCYLLILGIEVWPVQFVEGHHDRHHIFTVHDRYGEDVFGLILSQFIHKVTEMRALWKERERKRKEKEFNWIQLARSLPPRPSKLQDCTLMNTPLLSTNAASKGFPLSTNLRLSLLHSTYCSSCAAGVINSAPLGVKKRESGSLTAKKKQKRPAQSGPQGTRIGGRVLI